MKMATTGTITRVCETPGCNSPARLQCPTCLKLGIQGSFFCSQDCFKGNWKSHKVIHKIAKGEGVDSKDDQDQRPVWPNYRFTGKLRPHAQSKRRTVPSHIPRPDYATHPEGIPLSEQKMKGSAQIRTLTEEEIEGMRVSCKLGREVLDEAAKVIGVGVTTDEVDRIVHEACVERECYPSPLNYYEFPSSCCTSVNEVICHGIPDLRPLQDGDICNVDITVYHRGYHGDLNETFLIGDVKPTAKKLVQVTWECLDKSIQIAYSYASAYFAQHIAKSPLKTKGSRGGLLHFDHIYNEGNSFLCGCCIKVKPGEKYREIGNVIQKHAQNNGFSVVRGYCGHGIHKLFHTAPSIPHYAKNKAVGVMKYGHSFTIEPMISEGNWRDELWPDRWTAVTVDGMLSAQFEHTLLVTDTGAEILTARRSNNGNPYFLDKL